MTSETARLPMIRRILVASVLCGLLAAGACIPDTSPSAPGGPGTRPLPEWLPQEVRALWVGRTSLTVPDSLKVVVDRAEAGGFNTLLVEVRGRGDAWYESDREPRPIQWEDVPDDYDPLRVLLDEARFRGIQVHAWIVVHLVASADLLPADSLHIVHRQPDWLAVPRELAEFAQETDPGDPGYIEALAEWSLRNQDRVEGLYTSPAHPGVREHVTGIVEDLLDRYALQGVHLDYIRYPAPDFDFAPASLEFFAQWLREGTPRLSRLPISQEGEGSELILLPDSFPDHWDEFRRTQVTRQALEIAESVRSRHPDVLVSAAVFPDLDDARDVRFQPWDRWLEWGVVDVVAPMAYTPDAARFARYVDRARNLADSSRIWAGVGLFENTFVGAVAQVQRARSLELGGVALFSYDWAVGPDGSAAAGTGPGGYLYRWGQEGWLPGSQESATWAVPESKHRKGANPGG